jgi:hypothetical protein
VGFWLSVWSTIRTAILFSRLFATQHNGMARDSSPEFESKPAALAALLDGTWPAELQEA